MAQKRDYSKHPKINHRVEIAPHYDLWMRGAKFGIVVGQNLENGNLLVRMDHPSVKKLQAFPEADLKPAFC